jgi:hypothetical protein
MYVETKQLIVRSIDFWKIVTSTLVSRLTTDVWVRNATHALENPPYLLAEKKKGN